jgi:hypothetical protein
MKQILERIGSHQMLVALVLILIPLVAWLWGAVA